MSYPTPSFDEILAGILRDFQNTFPGVDVSQGSLAYMKAAGYASATWGLYQYQTWIARQIFPDSCNSIDLEHHANIRGLVRKVGETDAALLARLLDYIRRPPAGGNKYDYVKWALEVPGVSAAWPVPMGQGLGTVDLIIVADATTTGSIIPAQSLLDAVTAYIVDIMPTHVKTLRVLAPVIITQNITMTVIGTAANKPAITSEITSYLSTMVPGQTLYLTQLSSIATSNGADDCTITLPLANVVPTAYQMIQPGVINVG